MKLPRASRESRKMRSGQLITTYAPGSIITTLSGESFVVTTIDEWRDSVHDSGKLIELKRLAESASEFLNRPIEYFVSPMADDSFGNENRNTHAVSVPALRFPRWLRCKRCLFMKHWQYAQEQSLENLQLPQCDRVEDGIPCKGILAPVSYVIACKGGHMQDLDWQGLIHKGKRTCTRKDGFKWLKKEKGGSVGLKSEIVSCVHCEESLVMDDIYRGKRKFSCHVKQPWESDTKREPSGYCDEPTVIQRAAMNLHSPLVIRALDIPPEAFQESRAETKQPAFKELLELVKNAGCSPTDLMESDDDFEDDVSRFARNCRVSSEFILELISHEIAPKGPRKSLILGEYDAFLEARQPGNSCKTPNFVVRKGQLDRGRSAFANLDQLRVVDRLRQVSVVTHFTRIGGQIIFESDEEESNAVPVDLGVSKKNWLPGVEAFGEGIFLTLSAEKLESWWARSGQAVTERLENYPPKSFEDINVFEEAKFRIIHTLSHLMIRELSHRCGYAATSLSERLYCEGSSLNQAPAEFDKEESIQHLAGLLIYTTSGDLDGSMGGLVREAQPDRLEEVINQAVKAARWCSSDPICADKQQGVDGSNVSACHSCLLLPENSCQNLNGQLDRQLLIHEEYGFFNGEN
ncbi:DUF1998 domain-containing protein [Planctomycetota bacterium]|nr:DUF1998 domain-containing protein [Planctomycetota bacterium]